jgi:hypothetical protein
LKWYEPCPEPGRGGGCAFQEDNVWASDFSARDRFFLALLAGSPNELDTFFANILLGHPKDLNSVSELGKIFCVP